MHRVLIIGSGGSGKTTLARILAARTGLPLVHLDARYWNAGWVPTPRDEWDRQVREMVSRDRWILDGNYGRTLDLRLAACDTVILLDVPRLLCLRRVVRRQLRHWGKPRPDVAPGCPERLTWEFLWWIWTYPKRRRRGILGKLAALDGTKRVVVARSDRDVDAFLASVPRGGSHADAR